MAEAHPVGFRWVMKAKERGARVIHVDPRFSRTSAVADQHVPIRAGTDIAFLGGLIRHVIETESYFRDYVLNYTNASTLVNEDFRDTEDLGGVFSGFDPETGMYDPTSWMYEGGEVAAAAGVREHATQAFSEHTGAGMLTGDVERDETLRHERCVFQIVRRHFSRYTPEMVSRICGISEADFLAVADALIQNSGRERTSAFCYAVGWTQHSVGVQMIRAAAILQLLLGNIGRPGGGIIALRGHASIQGSTDIPTLYDLLPGYLPMPRGREGDFALRDYIESDRAPRGWWSFFDVYIVSLLKAWFGDAATAENDYGFGRLPKITGNHSHFPTMMRALDGGLEGLFVMGQNPAVGSQHSGLQRRALASLDWLVVRDLSEIETASFWRDSPEVRSGELEPEDIDTEVFLMPAASHVEKEGSFTNTQRLVQWRDKALEPPGDARSELWFMHHLAKRVKERYAGSDEERDWPITNLRWDYPEHGELAEPDAEAVLREVNGYDAESREPLSSFTDLRDDGSTVCGCWIYSGIYKDGVNQARRRDPGDLEAPGGWVSPEWAWAWPANRRILYNRASADPDGKPWSERKRFVWWDEDQETWTGYDVPDFPLDKRPDYRARGGRRGHGRHLRRRPVHDDGRRSRLALLAERTDRRSAPHPLRAGRVPRAEPPLPGARRQPRGDPVEAAGEPVQPVRRRAVPDRGDHVQAHRAPHGGWHEPEPPLAGRAPTRDVRRARPRARRRPRDRGRWLADAHDRARRDRGAREGDRAHPAPARGRPPAAPGGPPVALGLQRSLHGRLRQRRRGALRRPERHDPGVEGVHVRRARRS